MRRAGTGPITTCGWLRSRMTTIRQSCARGGSRKCDVGRRRTSNSRHVHIPRRSGDAMTTTGKLRELGQSLWLDNITRDLLNRGTLERYIDTLSLTGLTSNPTIFDQAIRNSTAYDEDIARAGPAARSTEEDRK